jgi:glyoxylase I family protein
VKLESIHHVAINVSNYERSKGFYVDQLGFCIMGEYVYPSGTRRLDCAAGQVRLEIFCGAVETGAFAERNIGYRHLCFYTENIETDVEELRAKGILVEDIRTDVMAGGRMTFFCDPDGITIELHE